MLSNTTGSPFSDLLGLHAVQSKHYQLLTEKKHVSLKNPKTTFFSHLKS
jgi:hypothetical protein